MKKRYYLLVFIVLLILLVSCQGNKKEEKPKETEAPSAMARDDRPYYDDIKMGRRTKADLCDKKDTDNRSAIRVDKGTSIAIQFYAVTDFRSISVSCPSYSNNIGSLRFSLYKWDLTYNKTVENEPVITEEFINFRDNASLALSTRTSWPEDEYLLVIEHIDEEVGVWYFSSRYEGIRLYNRDVEVSGCIESEIEYVNMPDVLLGPLSPNYWWLDGSSDVPAPFVVDESHPISKLNVKPDTWVATDGLGRTMPTYEEVGDKKDRYVGMFYWTWHSPYASSLIPRDLTKIIKEYPEAQNDYNHQIWKVEPVVYYWEEPIYGFYTASDKYVYRKHAELLADAGVDVVFFDATNGSEVWMLQYETLCEAWIEAMNDGIKAPKISFLMNFHSSTANMQNTVIQLEKVYMLLFRPQKYKELWFYWDDKPLLMARYDGLDEENRMHKEILDYFTFRPGNPSYYTEPESQDTWGWLSVYPQTKYGVDSKGNIEQICVGVSQNANDNGLTAMNGAGVYGRAYTKGNYSYTYKYKGADITIDKNIEDAKLYGLNFQQQWDYALENDPKFVWVTGWNERKVGRYETWGGVTNAFPDQFNDEFSRDIEPTIGDLKDHYYYQLVMNVRKFKGMEKPDPVQAEKTININKGYDQWTNVYPEFNHYTGNTPNRDEEGLNFDLHYENFTMRNDIAQAKVAYDKDYIYFLVRTVDKISPYTDPAWMRLFIDVGESDENWESFEYVINRQNPSASKAMLEKSTGGWNFDEVGEVDCTVSDNLLQIKVPRQMLGFNQEGMPEFTFKWADNSQNDGDIMDFYLNGDVAPGGRFKFAFVKSDELISPKKKTNTLVIVLIITLLLLLAFIVVFILKRKGIKV